MICSYKDNPDSGTICVLADGGEAGHCDSTIGNSTCACKDQICAVASNTCFPGFNVLDAGPNPCNVDSECGACGTVCFHDVSGTHACLGQVDAGLPGGFCLGTADCACNGQTCDTTTNFCNFPDAGPPVDAGTLDAGPPPTDGGPVVFCLSDHDCANPALGSGDGCGWVCGFKTTKPYKCVYASSGDPGICNVSGSNDCLTCGGVTQTCDTSSHTCTPPQYVPDGGPPPDAGSQTDGGGGVDSGTNLDAGLKICTNDADCGQLDQVCSHKTTPYHCVPASTGDPGFCTTGGSTNPCPAQGQTCIQNVCTPPYGSVVDGGEDAGTTSSSGCGSAPAKGGPDLGALLLALGLAGVAALAGRRRRRLE
jgi:MYXO-CTERM domain-containing protein